MSTDTAQAAAATFDFEEFEDVLSASVTIKNPATQAPTSMIVTIAGPEHPTRKRLMFEKMRRMRKSMLKNQTLTDPEEEDGDETELVIACTLGWQGGPVPYSPDAARAVLSNPKRRWLRDQIKAALDERERFISRSAPH